MCTFKLGKCVRAIFTARNVCHVLGQMPSTHNILYRDVKILMASCCRCAINVTHSGGNTMLLLLLVFKYNV